MKERNKTRKLVTGRPLAVDSFAKSASASEPAFIARPAGAPVYHGFQILEDVSVDGFTFGKITDFEAEPCEEGDAFVVAPDNSRAGLVWEVSKENYFREICAPESERWGVWGVSFSTPMTNRRDALTNLQFILPQLRVQWEKWNLGKPHK